MTLVKFKEKGKNLVGKGIQLNKYIRENETGVNRRYLKCLRKVKFGRNCPRTSSFLVLQYNYVLCIQNDPRAITMTFPNTVPNIIKNERL